MSVKSLHYAKSRKNDEFYTQLNYIADEMSNYARYFKGKVVYCNCDNPGESKFYEYFKVNFKKLGIKKLVTTCYRNSKCGELFDPEHRTEEAYLTIYDGKVKKTKLKGNGDFSSAECINILKKADIVVTNPPFSLFRKYIKQLVDYKKKFIIVGNMNFIACKEIFPLIEDNKIWFGVTNVTKFKTPKNKIKVIGTGCWFTNLSHQKRNEEIVLTNRFGIDMKYTKYDNYDAINVNKVVDIPRDYLGIMGVPISFLQKHNPDQFEILGITQRGCHNNVPDTKKYNDYIEVRQNGTKTGSSGNKTNENPVLAGKPDKGNYFVNETNESVVHSKFSRLFIKNKNPERK